MAKKITYSAIRKVNRNQVKKQVKEHNKGLPKKYRTKFSDIWHVFQEKRYGEKNYKTILRNNKKARK